MNKKKKKKRKKKIKPGLVAKAYFQCHILHLQILLVSEQRYTLASGYVKIYEKNIGRKVIKRTCTRSGTDTIEFHILP